MLDALFQKSIAFVQQNNLKYKRYFIKKVDFRHRLSIIQGPRGIGKSTSIAQYMSTQDNALYVSLDDIQHIGRYSMMDIASEFELSGGKLLCFDEIHKYPSWSGELKNIYDTYPELKVIATGSSALEIHKGSHDLSRRAIVYQMHGMSFREFLELHYQYEIPSYTLDDVLVHHIKIADEIVSELKEKEHRIIPLFREYLMYGYYPYYLDLRDKVMFFQTLQQNINTTIESDLINIFPSLTGASIRKMKLLLSIIMQSVPFTPNIKSLKEKVDVKDDRTLKEYLNKLDDAGLIKLLMKTPLSMKAFDKPEKIFLANTNLMYTGKPDIGSVRETFFMNQVQNFYVQQPGQTGNSIVASKVGDFRLEDKYVFEVGGKKKGFDQIKDLTDSYLAADDIEMGYKNKIPLWIFGFLY